MVKNLAQLKKIMTKGRKFNIAGHCRPEVIGERRMVNFADTTGIYTFIPSEPESINVNAGKGTFLGWSKAGFWEFKEDGVCVLYSSDKEKTPENLIIAIKPICDEDEKNG